MHVSEVSLANSATLGWYIDDILYFAKSDGKSALNFNSYIKYQNNATMYYLLTNGVSKLVSMTYKLRNYIVPTPKSEFHSVTRYLQMKGPTQYK